MIRGGRHADDERLTAAYTANAADLLTYFGRRVDVVADAVDLLGETFLIATRRSRQLPSSDEQARMWLFGIARNVLANAARGTARRHRFTAGLRGRPKVGPWWRRLFDGASGWRRPPGRGRFAHECTTDRIRPRVHI
nr:sigma factor [Agromyces laixinhei]